MSNKVIFKRSSVAGRVPDASSLDYGEVALNFADGRLYYKDSTNVVRYFEIPAVAGDGLGAVIDSKEYVATADGTSTYAVRYDVGFVDVHVNGVKLPTADFDGTDGTSVTISGLFIGDEISLIGYKLFNPYNATQYNRNTYTATAGQTTFNVDYTQDTVQVYVNGILLKPSEYTATSGTDIVLDVAASLDDVVECVGFSDFVLATSTIDSMTDVDISTVAPTDGQALIWDSATSTFIPGDSFSQSDFDTAFGLKSIGELSDVDITTTAPTSNQSLIWDAVNSKFIPGDSFSQADFDTAFAAKTTSDLSEGTNLYYTDARVDTEIDAYVTGGTGVAVNSGVISIGQPVATTDTVTFDNVISTNDVSTTTLTFGSTPDAVLSWNAVDGTVDIAYDGATLQVGQEQHYYGKATENIANGEVVMFAGVQGDHILIARADATVLGFIPEWVIGVATQDIVTNEFGYVTSFGKVRDIDTRGYTAGSLLWLNPSVPGALMTTPPAGNTDRVLVAAATNSTVNGTIFVRLTVRHTLDELPGVDVTAKTTGSLIVWNGTNWYASNDYYTSAETDSAIAAALPTSILDLGITDGTAGQVLSANGDGTFTFIDNPTAIASSYQKIVSNGSTAQFTLTQPVYNASHIIVTVESVIQSPIDAYNVSGTTLTFTSNPPVGAIIIIRYINVYGTLEIPETAASAPTTSSTVIDAFPLADYRSGEYTISCESGFNYHTLKLMVIHDGSTVNYTQYGDIIMGSAVGNFSAQINGADVEILFTGTSTNNTVTFKRILLSVA